MSAGRWMRPMRPMLVVLPLLMSTAGQAQPANFAAPEAPTSQAGYGDDLLPRDEKDRATLLRTVAFDATVYGMAAYLHYEQLYRQVFDRSSSNYSGFNRFAHLGNRATKRGDFFLLGRGKVFQHCRISYLWMRCFCQRGQFSKLYGPVNILCVKKFRPL